MVSIESEKKLLTAEALDLTFRNLFKDIIKYFPSKLCGLIGNAVVIPIYTNLLSTEQYGIYTLSIAFLSFLCILFSDWIGLSGLRFFKQHEIKADIPKYLSTLIGLLACNIITMFFIAFIFRHQFYSFFNLSPSIFFFVVLLIIPVSIRALFFQILRAQIKPLAFTCSTILNQILTITISIALIKIFHWGAYAMLMGMAISISIIDIILIYQSNIKEYFEFSKPKLNILSSLFKFGIPLAITSISLWGINQSNRFILNKLYSFKEVGYLGVAYGLTFSILNTIFVVITVAAYPRIINLFEERFDVRPVISRLTAYYTLLALPTVVIYSLYSENVVNFMANTKFHEAYVLIPYLSFSVFFFALAEYTTMQYMLSKKTYINTIIRVVSAIVGLSLNIYLIGKMGLVGLGIATLIGNAMYFILSILVNVKDLNWQIPYKKFCLIFVSFIPMGFLYCNFDKFNLHSWVEITLLTITYYITYFGFRKIVQNANYV